MPSGVNQLQHEIESIILRYSLESDITVCEALGILEIVKARLLDDALDMCDNDGDDDDELVNHES